MSNDSDEIILTLSSTDAVSDIQLCVDEQPAESLANLAPPEVPSPPATGELTARIPVPVRGLKREVTLDRLDVENAKKKTRREHRGVVASSDAATSSPGVKIVRFTPSTFEKVNIGMNCPQHWSEPCASFLANALEQAAHFSSLLDSIKTDDPASSSRTRVPATESSLLQQRNPHRRVERRNSFVVCHSHSTSVGLLSASMIHQSVTSSATQNRSNLSGSNFRPMRNETFFTPASSSGQHQHQFSAVTLGNYSKEDILRRIKELREKTRR